MSGKLRNERQELDIPFPLAVGIACVLLILIYLILLPLKDSFLGTLLYDRGFTQYAVVFLAGLVAAVTVLKFIKLRNELRATRLRWIPNNISFDEPASSQVANLQYHLANAGNLLTLRCSRILRAYIESGSRKTAVELALDDSSFYLSASEASYTVPRILVWAIPILGFIGTVVGISSAVNGFSGFLAEAGEIEQIKEGIGTVTSGLAIAFDTTLLALLLSVLVMIPLVFVERLESRLLLAIDVYLNEQLLPKLKERSENLDARAIDRTVTEALQKNLPSPQQLIEPAREYARQAASEIARTFVEEIGKVQESSEQLIQQMSQANKVVLKDRKTFIQTLDSQLKAQQEIADKLNAVVAEIHASQSTVSQFLQEQAEQTSSQLDRAVVALTDRLSALERCTEEVLEVAKLQQSIEQSLRSLQKTSQLEQVLSQIDLNLAQLKPTLDQLSKPRRITLVEREE